MKLALNLQKTLSEQLKDEMIRAYRRRMVILWDYLYREMADYSNAVNQASQSNEFAKRSWTTTARRYFLHYSQMGILYLAIKSFGFCFIYAQKGYDLGLNSMNLKNTFRLQLEHCGNVHVALHNYKLAEELFRCGIKQSGLNNNIYFQARNY